VTNIDLAGAVWRTSSFTQSNGECVEIAFPDADWRKSIRSQADGGCVEVALTPSVAGIRDSKQREGGAVIAGFQAWDAFRRAVKRADLDLR
jgi:hypothetical protein